jgi:manganese-dependent inorganic pyrophosphatase
MPDPIFILGHKNPDADAICSALAYEAYKHAIGETEYIAARCGNSNARIDAILERFNVPLPRFIGDVTPRVGNIMQKQVRSVTRENTCAEALELIDQHDVRALPVVDQHGKLEGLISIFQLGEFFIPKPNEQRAMRHVHTSISAIIRSLNAKVLHQENADPVEELFVRVGAMDIRSFDSHYKENGTTADTSIIIVGDRWDIQARCLELGVRLLVITGGLEVNEDIIASAKKKHISLIVSPYDSASTSWIIRSATYIDGLVHSGVKCFTPDDRIESVKRRIGNANDALYMVVNEDKELIGVFSKSDILRPSKTRIALVDHNELGQAVNGAAHVQITEILDHHRLGNIPTDLPILFINRPVGSTCSIVADLFRAKALTPSPGIAGVIMAGIISDTLHLNSPTTTPLEGELLQWLAPIAGISPHDLAELIFSSGSVIIGHTPDEVVCSDCKIYADGNVRYSVSQIEELGFDHFWKKEDELDAALEAYRTRENLLVSFLLVTDINTQNSLLIVAGNDELKSQIHFTPHGQNNIYDLPGIVSRKKQLIPYISTLFKTMGIIA